MAHTHDNGSYTSASNSHLHTKVQTAKVCKATWPTHTHSATFPLADAHTHDVVLAFASASLGSPNWWEHTHAISLVSCGNGGSNHNHTSTLLGAQCADCPTPASHTHAQGTTAIAGTDATHAHTYAGGNTGNADPAGTSAAHTHAFSITLDVSAGHNHTVSGTYASKVCDGGYNHNHAANTPTGNSNHTQGVSGSTPSGGESSATAHTGTFTEIFGALDSKTRTKTTHRTSTEILGSSDTKTRTKTIHRTLIELLGGLDAKTRTRSIPRAFTELLGASDSETRTKTVNRAFSEALGGLDLRTRVKTIYREITEKLGLADSKSRAKSIFRSILETLGLLDTSSGTTSGFPPSTVDSGSPRPLKPLDLSIEEYGLFALLISRLRRKRTARLSTHTDVAPPKPVPPSVQELKDLFIAALMEEGMSEGEAEEKYVEAQAEQRFVFVAVSDDATCEDCLDRDGETFSREEIDAEFPFAEEVNEGLIMPMVHPNCRCMLALL